MTGHVKKVVLGRWFNNDFNKEKTVAKTEQAIEEMSKEELVEAYEGLVESVVEKSWSNCIGAMSIGDMRSCAYEGLLQAYANFEPGQGNAFSTFAYLRIQGAIYDGFRRARWGPRTREVACRDDVTAAKLKTGTGACSQESNLKDCSEEGQEAQEEQESGPMPLQMLMMGPTEFERLDLAERESQDETVTQQQLKGLVSEAMSELGQIERVIVRLHDIEGRSLSDIAEEVDCSKGWASRLRERAIDQIRVYVEQKTAPMHSGEESAASRSSCDRKAA